MANAPPQNVALQGSIDGIDVAVLAGGLGKRVKSVLGNTPKVLAPIGDQTYLDFLIDWLYEAGAGRLVLCLGHLSHKVMSHLKEQDFQPLTIDMIVEPQPLGTAGAIRFARPVLRTDTVMIMNGDTFINADIGSFLAEHLASDAAISILCVEVPDVCRYGQVVLDQKSYISHFEEKSATASHRGLVNAGIYLFSQRGLDQVMTLHGSSLERDIFQMLPRGTIHACVAPESDFIDIGTPESLSLANLFFSVRKHPQ